MFFKMSVGRGCGLKWPEELHDVGTVEEHVLASYVSKGLSISITLFSSFYRVAWEILEIGKVGSTLLTFFSIWFSTFRKLKFMIFLMKEPFFFNLGSLKFEVFVQCNELRGDTFGLCRVKNELFCEDVMENWAILVWAVLDWLAFQKLSVAVIV